MESDSTMYAVFFILRILLSLCFVVVRLIKSRRMRWAENEMGRASGAYGEGEGGV